MRVVIIDNFDSFTHNLAQGFGGLGADVTVVRNSVSAAAIADLAPDRLVLSPGPGTPDRTGSCAEVLDRLAGRVPVLGVCLGMQLIAARGGASVVRAEPVHGRASAVTHDGEGVFAGLASPCRVGRYHSLMVDAGTLPSSLKPTAWSGDVLMGLRHVEQAIEGVQFHPESVLTPDGLAMLANFLEGRDLGGRPPDAAR